MEKAKNFGFGAMRLPMTGDEKKEVDLARTSRMVDLFLQSGFCYFDTAHGYLDGESERALKACLTSRYPREAYLLTDKLTGSFFEKEEDIRPLFESQLEACGVSYFDYYLMHSQNAEIYPKFVACRAYETAAQLKKEGKICHVGISFHDKAEVLEQILKEQPSIEVVQIQFNYVDYEDPSIEGRKCYEVCRKYGKPILVMEPVKGGSLASLPQEAQQVLDALCGGSSASYAIRFAASFEGVEMVLSGMSDEAQMKENLRFMKEFIPLSQEEFGALRKVSALFKKQGLIACTACRYCTHDCPAKIDIPGLFACMNAKKQFQDWNSDFYYSVSTHGKGKASDCVKCGRCEAACPQHLPIRELLEKVAAVFEAQKENS